MEYIAITAILPNSNGKAHKQNINPTLTSAKRQMRGPVGL